MSNEAYIRSLSRGIALLIKRVEKLESEQLDAEIAEVRELAEGLEHRLDKLRAQTDTLRESKEEIK